VYATDGNLVDSDVFVENRVDSIPGYIPRRSAA